MEQEPEHDGQEPKGESEPSASDDIAYAVADLLRSQQLLDALKGWVAARTNEMPAETSLKKQSSGSALRSALRFSWAWRFSDTSR
jgi:hypothetical protein